MDQSSAKNISKWENMTREELIEFVKKLLLIQKKLKRQIKGGQKEAEAPFSLKPPLLYEVSSGQDSIPKPVHDVGASTESECGCEDNRARRRNFRSRYKRLLSDYEKLYVLVEERLSALEEQERLVTSTMGETFELLKPILSRFRLRVTSQDVSSHREITESSLAENECQSRRKDQQIKQLVEQLQIAKQEIAQKSLAILELEDYRNLVQDLHEQIKSLRVKIEKQTEAATIVNERYESLAKERDELLGETDKYKLMAKSLEEKVARTEENNSDLQNQLHQAATREWELNERVSQLKDDLSDAMHRLESAEVEKKRERGELAERVTDKCNRIAELEKSLQLQVREMSDIKAAYESTVQEHANYKRKVAEVLRRNSNAEAGNGELKHSQEKLLVFRQKLEASESQLTSLTKELADSRAKIDKQQKHIAQLSETIRVQEDAFQNELQELKSSLINGEEKLKEDLHQFRCDNIQLRNLNQELLDSSKKLLAELADKEREVCTLQYDLNAMTVRAEEMTFKSERLEKALEILRENSKAKSTLNRDDDSKTNSRMPPTQLEAILRGDYTGPPSRVLFSDGDDESRMNNLAELEAENLRLKELTATLKLELSRIEANEKRRPLLEKAEYLKNVLLKFLSLTNAEERVVLVPVIAKLLVLNEEETERLRMATGPGNWW